MQEGKYTGRGIGTLKGRRDFPCYLLALLEPFDGCLVLPDSRPSRAHAVPDMLGSDCFAATLP
jgi:hypothetical protein